MYPRPLSPGLSLIRLQYSYLEALELFDLCRLRVINSWKAPNSEYRLWLLERPEVKLLDRMTIAAQAKTDAVATTGRLDSHKGVPTLQEWEDQWTLWDQ